MACRSSTTTRWRADRGTTCPWRRKSSPSADCRAAVMKDVNGVEKGVREMGLLIQLFGREVIERLAQAGFDSSETIVQAGPERLAEAGGIPAPLARRIVAV